MKPSIDELSRRVQSLSGLVDAGKPPHFLRNTPEGFAWEDWVWLHLTPEEQRQLDEIAQQFQEQKIGFGPERDRQLHRFGEIRGAGEARAYAENMGAWNKFFQEWRISDRAKQSGPWLPVGKEKTGAVS
jgi:hypothetical protein